MNKPIDWKLFRDNLFWSNVLCRALVVSNSGASPSWGWRHDDSGKLEGEAIHCGRGEAIYPLASKLEQLGLDWRFSRMVAGPCYQASNPPSEPSARPHLCLPAYLHPKLFIEAQLGRQSISKSQKQKQLISNKSFSLVPILGLFFIYIFSLSIHSLIHPCIHVIQMINLSSASSSWLWKPPWNSSLRHILWNQSALILQKATVVV